MWLMVSQEKILTNKNISITLSTNRYYEYCDADIMSCVVYNMVSYECIWWYAIYTHLLIMIDDDCCFPQKKYNRIWYVLYL